MTIWIFEHFWMSKIEKSRQNSLSDNVLFDATPVSQYVLNEGVDNKLNSMDSVLVDIGNVDVVIM